MRQFLAVVCIFALISPTHGQKEAAPVAPRIAEAKKDPNGFLVHAVEADNQSGPTEIRVLLPDKLQKDRRYPVVYVLPVEAGNEKHFGDGLLEVKKDDLANKFDVICVAPTFARLPWYADHPTNAKIAQETYFVKVVVPFVESKYPALAEARGRLLLGFSKSGCGAFTLLLRQPEVFGKAAAWDAPFTMARYDLFGAGDIFGTPEHFDKYRVPRLLEQRAAELQKDKRLAIVGHASFAAHHKAAHELLDKLKIPHEYLDKARDKHTWGSGWVPDAVRFLAGPERDK